MFFNKFGLLSICFFGTVSNAPATEESPFSPEMLDCIGNDEIYFEGECHRPGSIDPCDNGEWVVLTMRNDSKIEAECKEMPCGVKAMHGGQQCQEPDLDCDFREEKQYDPFGQLICVCNSGGTDPYYPYNGECLFEGLTADCDEGSVLKLTGTDTLECQTTTTTTATTTTTTTTTLDERNFTNGRRPTFPTLPPTRTTRFPFFGTTIVPLSGNFCDAGFVFKRGLKKCVRGTTTGKSDNLEEYLSRLLR